MKKILLIGLVMTIAAGLTGCLSLADTTVTTLTPKPPTITPTITPTILWFPVTPTATLQPVLPPQPTADQRPNIGGVFLQDDFKDPISWETIRSELGTVSVAANELTIALNQPRGTMLSLRKGELPTSYYLEIMIDVSLCAGSDSYGLLLRAASRQDYDRLVIACNGQLRLERARGGVYGVVVDWMPSGQVLAGAPFTATVGVWVFGSEMRFFINDIFQFSARDPLVEGSHFGLFASSASDTPVTVSFGQLVVRSVENYRPSPVPSDTPFPTPKK